MKVCWLDSVDYGIDWNRKIARSILASLTGSDYFSTQMETTQPNRSEEDMFRPPLARGMQVLDRSIFQKTVPLKAARVFDNKNISKIRSELEKSRDALRQDRLANVHADPDPERAKSGKKCILLRSEAEQRQTNGERLTNGMSNGDPHTGWPHSPTVSELVKQGLISVIPYNLHLDYDYWTYHDIISAVLPTAALDEVPSGFSQVGHVAHMNLREQYLPHKHLIASIILDKNSGVRTVINKIDDVGEESEFRTFKYEVLAGEDDMNVVVSEANCEFRFDYSKVYWNPRLSTEHARLVNWFKEGEAVCDVMAGIGPFAVPAGRKGVFVWANDLNPESFACLTDAVKRNKVGEYVRPFCADGNKFIRDSAAQLLDDERTVEVKRRASRKEDRANGSNETVVKTLRQPKMFQHYVLNLPASALTFLPSFIGLYPPELHAKLPSNEPMPIIHAYCFNTKDELDDATGTDGDQDSSDVQPPRGAVQKICAEISMQLGFKMWPGKIDEEEPGAIGIWDVRDVAPKKRMFCASFRLPAKVAFRRTT